MKEFIPPYLPLKEDIEDKEILKKAISANIALARLNGLAKSLPNQTIFINTLSLQEAKDSSEIENIITTHDELFRSSISADFLDKSVKEVQNYKRALFLGFEIIKQNGFLSTNHIKAIQAQLEQNSAGLRKQSGTMLKNPHTGEIKFIPPQDPKVVVMLIDNLAKYFNDNAMQDFDPLVKMAILHYQFESIHPFYDGNGRTGRILNILYLVLHNLLEIPILYLSKYIIKHKADYYRLLNRVSFESGMKDWVLFMLDGVYEVSNQTTMMIEQIELLMEKTRAKIESDLPKIYSKDLSEQLFYHPYTKISFLEESLHITRKTASNYLKELEKIGVMSSEKRGREIFYINQELFDLFRNG